MKQKLLLVAALFFGVLAFILTYYQLKYEKDKIRGQAQNFYFIKVKKDMIEGEPISKADIESFSALRQVSARKLEIEWKEADSIAGRKLSRSVKRGDLLTVYDIKEEGKTGREGLAGIIPMGFRAISISVDSTSSVTGLVKPNHHVDIIGTFSFPQMKGDKNLDTLTLTLLQNVVILATGTEMAASKGGEERAKKNYGTVTLELTPEETEMIIFASQKGRLTLSLRNFEETKIEKDLQSVNFKFLEENIRKWNDDREKMMKEGRNTRR